MRTTKIEMSILATIILAIGYFFVWPIYTDIAKHEKPLAVANVAPAVNADQVCARDDVEQSAKIVFKNYFLQRSSEVAFTVEDSYRQFFTEVDPQFIEVRGGGIAKTQDGLNSAVTCQAVVKMDASTPDVGPVVLELHDYVYVVAFTQPTNDLASKGYTIQLYEKGSFKQSFFNARPFKLFANMGKQPSKPAPDSCAPDCPAMDYYDDEGDGGDNTDAENLYSIAKDAAGEDYANKIVEGN